MTKPLKQKDDEEALIATTDDSWHQGATKVAVTDFDQSDKEIRDWKPQKAFLGEEEGLLF